MRIVRASPFIRDANIPLRLQNQQKEFQNMQNLKITAFFVFYLE